MFTLFRVAILIPAVGLALVHARPMPSRSREASVVAPVITSLAPPSAPLLGETFTLTVNGDGFVETSVVRMNGTPRTTTFVNARRLQALIPASALTSPGTVSVQVVSGPEKGNASGVLPFPIMLATPTIVALSPDKRQFGLGAFTLAVTGSNFIRSATVRWNGTTRATTWVSPSQLTALIGADDIASLGHATVSVQVVAPDVGSRESATQNFDIASPAPVLSGPPVPLPIVRFEPVVVTFTGSKFMPQIGVTVNGSPRTTTFVNANQVRVALDASDVDVAGQLTLRFSNPAPTIATANALLGVLNPVSVLTSISPKTVLVGSKEFTLAVIGSNFVSGSAVYVNGSPRSTTRLSNTELRATIRATDLTQGGDLQITAMAQPTLGASNALILTRLYPQVIIKP